MKKYYHLLLLLLLLLSSRLSQVSANTEAEAEALLNWSSSLPSQSLSTWSLNSTNGSTSPCKWIGIICNNDGSIVKINLTDSGLGGTLNPLNFTAFPNLISLRLKSNKIEGEIPTQIGTLSELTHLDLSNNSFTGTLPSEIGNLSNLEELDLSHNVITDSIPPTIGKLHNIMSLNLSQNELTGKLPPEIGNLTQLVSLELQNNKFTGTLPAEIGNLAQLHSLQLQRNQLTGTLPPHIGNLTQLTFFHLLNNSLTGPVPPEIGDLKSLKILDMSYNQFSGTLPQDFGRKTSLVSVTFSGNRLSGSLPPYICNGFNLVKLTVDSNNFTGDLPSCLKNCTKLVRVRLEKNLFTGNISHVFGVHPSLDYIDLTGNHLSGELSPEWGKCENLTSLSISENLISGGIPPEIGQLSKLRALNLSSNHLTGNIPSQLGQLKLLFMLNLSNNQLSGKIPPDLGKLSALKKLDLSRNRLTGSIPEQLGDCSYLLQMNLGNNNLTGDIPFQIGKFVQLQSLLDLSSNSLTGNIPTSLGSLGALEILDLSNNELSGSIPSSLSDMISLTFINLSNNNLTGPIPDSHVFRVAPFSDFSGNRYLCGKGLGLQPCDDSSSTNIHRKKQPKHVIGITVPLVAPLLIVAVVISVIVVLKKMKLTDSDAQRLMEQHEFSIWARGWKFNSIHVVNATGNFNERYCIGKGGFGNVYKAILPTGLVVAVKRCNRYEDGMSSDRKSFENEISVLTEIRHRNIVKLYGFSRENNCMFLVYEYFENGSLGDVLNREEEGIERLDWRRRLKIIEGVAHALSYLHHDCSPPVVHRDISSSNVLLDSSLEPKISDFGIAKVLASNTSSWTTVAGTYGYMAPELAYTMRVNEKCDVYSFGVITLEVIMGRHPGDLISSLSSSQGILLNDVLDKRLAPPTGQLAKEVILAVTMGLSCVRVDPESRPSMRYISQELSLASQLISPRPLMQ